MFINQMFNQKTKQRLSAYILIRKCLNTTATCTTITEIPNSFHDNMGDTGLEPVTPCLSNEEKKK